MTSQENIKSKGLKVTPQRKMVYEALSTLRHATIDDIIRYVQKQDERLTTSTIYRILDSFCQTQLISCVFHPTTGKCYYDITNTGHHHIFDGKNIIDYKDSSLTDIIRQYLEIHHFASDDIEKIQVQITVKEKITNF